MSEFEPVPPHTQHLINFNALNDASLTKFYRTARLHQEANSEKPLKKFHEYFGKIQPSLYHQLRNIFEHSSFQERCASPQPEYQVQGVMMGQRGRQLKPKQRTELSPIHNHFTIQSLNSRSLYRKAKLNRLILCHETLKQDIPQEEAKSLMRQSGELITQLQSTLTKNSTGRYNSTQRSFRVSRGSIEKQSFLQLINPNNRQRFTFIDLNQAICLLHHIDIQISPNISYFNVFVEQGNNSQLLKSLVRKRNGWRVVEIPAIANLIWTQFYRRGFLKKRLHKREKSETEQDKQKMIVRAENFKRMKVLSNDRRYDVSRTSQNSLSKSMQSDSFNAELRKLIAACEAQQVSKMRRSDLKTLKNIQISHNVLVHNHFPLNSCISDKKNLLLHLSRYLESKGRNVFQFVPQSFELNDLNHPIIEALQNGQNIKEHWLIKPGQNSNRGRGISILHTSDEVIQQLKKRLNQQSQQRQSITQRRKRRSVILQRYIRPLLYFGRKFDIRSYMLVTYLNKQLRMYCYQECYIRTSSKLFDIDSTNRLVHLTNDAIQSHSADYGKFQQGNKVAEVAFSRFIDDEYKRKNGNSNGIWLSLKNQMQNRCIDVMQSSYQTLVKGIHKGASECQSEQSEQSYYFQLFGMDFMIDEEFHLWLIEVNTNPAITHDCSKVLNRLIPKMLDNVFAIAVQPIMRPFRLQDLPYNNQFTAVFKKQLE